MKRVHTLVSRSEAGADTPLPLAGKKCRQQGFVGTPVEGLTGMPVDAPTPDSEGLQRPQIPDTTLRRVEGFCLNTPLSLSQCAAAETPTLYTGKQSEANQAHQEQQQDASATCTAAEQRHRLANISNLPLGQGYTASKSACKTGSNNEYSPMDCRTCQKQRPQKQHGRQQNRSQQQQGSRVTFEPNLMSPPASLPSMFQYAASTPYTSAAGANVDDEDDCGFILHSQPTYSRSQQPAISPNVAAGLSVPDQDEDDDDLPEEDGEGAFAQCAAKPFTTPSQDSREPPRDSPSTVTFSNATTSLDQADPDAGSLALLPPMQHLQQQLQREPSQQSAFAAAAAAVGPPIGPSRFGSNSSSQSLFNRSMSLGGLASCTPGDSLALLQDGELEETTTPELEQIGIDSQDFGGSQLSAGAGTNRKAAAGTTAAAGAAAGAGGSRGGVVCEEVTTKQVLFPIFRPKHCRKCIILVRHGESTYNKLDAHGPKWSDPTVFDAPLTAKGKQQAQAAFKDLSRQLDKHSHMGNILWLTSPLSRAIETMLLAYPDVEHLAQGQPGMSGHQLTAQPAKHKVMVLSMISEHCATTGDVGRPRSKLMQRFPSLATQLEDLPEQWWFNPCPENFNCAERQRFGRKETIDEMRRRVSEFSRWLRNREEQLVVAFGHSTFWKYFSNSKTKMKNCEVMQLWW